MKIFLYILLLICLILIVILIHIKNKIKIINSTLQEVCNGNFNSYFRVYPSIKSIEKLSEYLNFLVEEVRDIKHKSIKLEEERRRMISNVSHDLRTPLTSILGYIEALENDLSLSENDKKEFISIIKRKSEGICYLTEHFFQLAKLESGDTTIEMEKINIVKIVKDSILDFYNDFTNDNIEPVIDIKKDILYVNGSEPYVKRIMNNLLSNALRYGKYGKVIGISIREEENKIWIDVWNKGEVIKESDIPYIFERTYTGDSSRTNHLKVKGNGIGLTVVKKLVELQNGEIIVSSEDKEGTKFSFYLHRYK